MAANSKKGPKEGKNNASKRAERKSTAVKSPAPQAFKGTFRKQEIRRVVSR
jgi:hypothetical protein